MNQPYAPDERRPPECGCYRCTKRRCDLAPRTDGPLGIDPRMAVMFLCSECGNKRCPHAADHANECTGSNEPGQAGSLYEDAPPRCSECFQPDGQPCGNPDGFCPRKHTQRRAENPTPWTDKIAPFTVLDDYERAAAVGMDQAELEERGEVEPYAGHKIMLADNTARMLESMKAAGAIQGYSLQVDKHGAIFRIDPIPAVSLSDHLHQGGEGETTAPESGRRLQREVWPMEAMADYSRVVGEKRTATLEELMALHTAWLAFDDAACQIGYARPWEMTEAYRKLEDARKAFRRLVVGHDVP